MKLKVELSCRDDNHKKKYVAELFDGNIFVDDDNILPNCQDKVMNFTYQYRPTYHKYSGGKVNTRFSYPYSGGYKNTEIEGAFKIYANINWFDRMKLSIIARNSWFHKHPIATITLLFNILLGVANFIFAFINLELQSNYSYQKTNKQQSEILLEMSALLQQQTEAMMKINKNNDQIDSVRRNEFLQKQSYTDTLNNDFNKEKLSNK